MTYRYFSKHARLSDIIKNCQQMNLFGQLSFEDAYCLSKISANVYMLVNFRYDLEWFLWILMSP